jgi:hypothetical protein
VNLKPFTVNPVHRALYIAMGGAMAKDVAAFWFAFLLAEPSYMALMFGVGPVF